MLIIDFKSISNLDINYSEVFNWVDASIRSKKNTVLPAKLSLKLKNDGFLNVMPSILPDLNVSGLKVVSRYSSRIPTLDSDILLYDLESGALKGLIDANFITAIRTGTVAIHSVKLLAKEDFSTVAFIGLGIQAKASMKMLSSTFLDRKLTIKLFKYKKQHIQFKEYIESLTNADNYSIVYCDTYESTIEDSDVILSAVTYFDGDICDTRHFKDGCLLVPIHTRGFMNCDLSFDKIFVDDIDHVRGFKNFNNFQHKMNEVSDVLNEVTVGRENKNEKIIAYNIGIAIHDLFIANKIYELAKEENILGEVVYNKPNSHEWFN